MILLPFSHKFIILLFLCFQNLWVILQFLTFILLPPSLRLSPFIYLVFFYVKLYSPSFTCSCLMSLYQNLIRYTTIISSSATFTHFLTNSYILSKSFPSNLLRPVYKMNNNCRGQTVLRYSLIGPLHFQRIMFSAFRTVFGLKDIRHYGSFLSLSFASLDERKWWLFCRAR
jgi:hypothetical protein